MPRFSLRYKIGMLFYVHFLHMLCFYLLKILFSEYLEIHFISLIICSRKRVIFMNSDYCLDNLNVDLYNRSRTTVTLYDLRHKLITMTTPLPMGDTVVRTMQDGVMVYVLTSSGTLQIQFIAK